MRGTLEVGLKAFLHPRHQRCTVEAQKAETIVDRFSASWLRTICDVLVAFNFAGRDADARRLPKECGAAFST